MTTLSRVLTALLCGCSVSLSAACNLLPPRLVARGEGVVAYAPSQEEAEELVRAFERIQPLLTSRLPHLRDVAGDIEVWIQDLRGAWPYRVRRGVAGIAQREKNRIRLLPAEDWTGSLAHELVHLRIDETWQRLPGALEEGLCELGREAATGKSELRGLAALRAVLGQYSIELQFDRSTEEVVTASLPISLQGPEGRRWTADDLFGITTEEMQFVEEDVVIAAAYGLGHLVVTELEARVGLEGLYGLCERARDEGHDRVPIERIREACEVEEDGDWVELALRRSSPELLVAFVEREVADTLEVLPEAIRAHAGMDSAEEWLRRGRPRLVDRQAGIALDVETTPKLRELLASW